MKRFIIICFICLGQNLLAQVGVGINTSGSLSGILHIDSNGNNAMGSPVRFSDDVVIDTQGNMKIGGLNPSAKLDINGTLRLVDGTEGASKALKSNDEGIAAWDELAVNRTGTWVLKNDSHYFEKTSTPLLLTGVSDVIEDEIGLQAVVDGVVIPKGNYLAIISGDTDGNEYLGIRLFDNNGNMQIAIASQDKIAGVAFVITVMDDFQSYKLVYTTPLDLPPYYMVAPFTAGFKYSLLLIKL